MRTILLNSSYEPIGIVSWFKGFSLVFEGKADQVWSYPDKKIRSQHAEFEWPAIVILKTYVRRKPDRMINPSTRAILVRDLYTCQYCGKKLTNTSGTKDHVYPESLGGKSSWENLVAACKICQQIKADRLLEDVPLKLARIPKAPSLFERFKNNLRISSAAERSVWKMGFKNLGLEHFLSEGK